MDLRFENPSAGRPNSMLARYPLFALAFQNLAVEFASRYLGWNCLNELVVEPFPQLADWTAYLFILSRHRTFPNSKCK
jgi:hypothetical protein